MTMKSSITAEKRAEAAALYSEGYTLKELVARLGYSIPTWHKLLRRGENKAVKRAKASERELAMLKEHLGGKSFGEMAAIHGITRQRAHQLVKRAKERVDKSVLEAMVVEEKEIDS